MRLGKKSRMSLENKNKDAITKDDAAKETQKFVEKEEVYETLL